jgi:uncharacterized protein (DUF1800 family)
MATPTAMSPTAIALNRFGLGARPDDMLTNDPKKWLLAQFSQYQATPAVWATLPKTNEVMAEFAEYKKLKTQNKTEENGDKKGAASSMFRHGVRDDYAAAVRARVEISLTTPAPFVERLVHFWANHFAISIEKLPVLDLSGSYELNAIRANVLGNFKDMLFAVEQHPAMLLFLDQANSIGPNSFAASRLAVRRPEKKRGLNENLAREIMELHTLGVRSGYTQDDVIEFARALTGWSIQLENRDTEMQEGNHGFVFRPMLHEPGTRTILGKSYNQTGKAQGDAILNDLAASASTANHIATKLARHFAGDSPPDSLIEKLKNNFIYTKGDLPSLYKTLVDAPEAWQTTPAKFKNPWEWLISSMRALGKQESNIMAVPLLNQLGMPVWKPGSPAGYDDITETWASPSALLRRVELAQRLVTSYGDTLDARTLSDKVLVGAISPQTKSAISRAESATTGLALMLVCPEFLRR